MKHMMIIFTEWEKNVLLHGLRTAHDAISATFLGHENNDAVQRIQAGITKLQMRIESAPCLRSGLVTGYCCMGNHEECSVPECGCECHAAKTFAKLYANEKFGRLGE